MKLIPLNEIKEILSFSVSFYDSIATMGSEEYFTQMTDYLVDMEIYCIENALHVHSWHNDENASMVYEIRKGRMIVNWDNWPEYRIADKSEFPDPYIPSADDFYHRSSN